MYSLRDRFTTKPQGVFDHAALALVVAHRRDEHRQPGSVTGRPAGWPERIRIEIELRAVRGLPSALGQFHLPGFPNRTDSGRDHDSMAIAAVVVRVHLPLLQSQVSCSARPRFDRLVGGNRIAAIRIRAAVEVRFIGIIQERDRDARLIVRHEDVIHFVKRLQRLATAQVRLDLGDHRVRVRQERATRDVFVPGIIARHDLHRGNDGVSRRRVEQGRRGHDWRRAEDASLVIDSLGLGHGRQPEQEQQDASRDHRSPKAAVIML